MQLPQFFQRAAVPAVALVLAWGAPAPGDAASILTPADGMLGTVDAANPSKGGSRINMDVGEEIDDSFAFTVDGGTSGGLSAWIGASFVSEMFNIDDFAFELLDSSSVVVFNDSGEADLSAMGFLANGDYTLNVTGTTAVQGTSYSVSVNTSVVPLPPALMMFASALAALGFFGYRRESAA